jgi:hypothetical protein
VLWTVPDDLLTALWLQFALAISGDKRFRQCRTCGMWYELEPETARATKLFCSDACKTKAYRGRKAQAHQLWSRDKRAEDIVMALGLDEATLSRWVAEWKQESTNQEKRTF